MTQLLTQRITTGTVVQELEVTKGSEFQKRWLRLYDQKLAKEKAGKGTP